MSLLSPALVRISKYVVGLTNALEQCWESEQLLETHVGSFLTEARALPGGKGRPAAGYLVAVLLLDLPLGAL